MTESICDRTLEELFNRSLQKLVGGEVVIECFQSAEQPVHVFVPGLGRGVVPFALAVGHRQSPVQQIAEMGKDIAGSPDRVTTTKFSKFRGRAEIGRASCRESGW